ncbi:MAG: hypothetical protein AAGK00_07305 [Pseudomonadota bacterium]
MSDDKKKDAGTEEKDVVAQVDPEHLSDEQLEGADGGWSWSMSQSLKTSSVKIPGGDQFDVGIDPDTINATGGKDSLTIDAKGSGDLTGESTKFLRVRPGRIGPSTFGGG